MCGFVPVKFHNPKTYIFLLVTTIDYQILKIKLKGFLWSSIHISLTFKFIFTMLTRRFFQDCDNEDMLDEEEARQRRDALARRPSYR